MEDNASTVYLVDDDERVRVSLTRLLATAGHVVRSYASAEDFLSHHDPAIPGCAVIDLSLPGMDGFGIQEALISGRVNRPVIFVTGYGDVPTSVRAMKAGAVDFLTKPVDASVLLATIADALARDRQARREGERRDAVDQRLASLTPREHQVLAHVAAGRLNKQIAGDLGTVEKTVKVHRARMMKKMGVRTVADLVRLVTSMDPSGGAAALASGPTTTRPPNTVEHADGRGRSDR
jgi:FixJ family two-component response regulator